MAKSTRLQQIDGYFHGIHFNVKPAPINIRQKEKKVNEMMQDWYRENHPEVLEQYYDDNDIKNASADELQEIGEHFEKMFKWMEDVEFRSEFLRTKAEYAMDFDDPVPEDLWRSDELQYTTINEAWDFFCGRRPIP